MKLQLIAIGTKMPTWVTNIFAEYQKRLPREFKLELTEISAEKRNKTSNIAQLTKKEGLKTLALIKKEAFCIALDEHGKQYSTKEFAAKLNDLQLNYKEVSILIGGPDGLDETCLARANTCMSLSKLTFPHPLVRVILAEQLYRAVSLLHNHPYHRE